MNSPRDLDLASAPYLEDLYQRYTADPSSVDPEWVKLFARVASARAAAPPMPAAAVSPVIGVYDLIHSYRELGHLIANLDPLGNNRGEHPLLALGEFGFSEDDLGRVMSSGTFRGLGPAAPLGEIVAALRHTYCGTLGVEFTDIPDKPQRQWLCDRMEPHRNQPELSNDERVHILSRLVAAEDFERFLQAKYPTQKRFSLEGAEALIPLLDTVIEEAAELGVREMVMGMSHRGRVNVLTNILRKPFEMVLTEFEGTLLPRDVMGDGDVKYHLGYSRDHSTRAGHPIHLSLSFNPSHLEMINPVIEGMVRAKQAHLGDAERSSVVPVLIHGDAAFNGEGIVPETLVLSELKGYGSGGTIHIIVNNQIGFTTSPVDYRFTLYASDIAKLLRVPVFHVNGDDPEAAVHAARLAIAFRQAFKKDVIIDLICYRRHGHNEIDDPTFTQPLEYQAIAHHPSARELYERRLVEAGVISADAARAIAADLREVLDAALEYARDFMPRQQVFALGGLWQGVTWAGDDWTADTAVDAEVLRQVGAVYGRVPPEVHIQPKLKRLMETRAQAIEAGAGIDWGGGEALAIGTLLLEGTRVRLSGQDSGRGTFSHRHAVWHDVETGAPYVPLNHIAAEQAEAEILDSPLSEAAVLGFEYGMSSADPHRLVMWEAQFGDFANVAQVFIDQFIASAESKWQRMNGLVLLLPHGYEGQGPEHSSARLERFLQLCAEDNLQVCNLTTPAQYFHALRRQIHRRFRKPLVIMTPKSLLRHRLAVSVLDDFTTSGFATVLDDREVSDPGKVQRILLCSGRVFYPLLEARRERDAGHVAIVRVEQLYPFPQRELAAVMARYPAARDVRWLQEEPWNQGAWQFVSLRLSSVLRSDQTIGYIGREEAASPATGLYKLHQREEAEILNRALARPTAVRAAAPRAEAAAGG